LEGYDEVVVDQLAAAIANDGYRMQALVVGVVTSYPFTHRRLDSQGDAPRAKVRNGSVVGPASAGWASRSGCR
jgi:hypothetical protein